MKRDFGIGHNGRPGGFVCYWWFTGWDCISLGLHVCTSAPNVEIHLPFGFVRIGRRSAPHILTIDDIEIVEIQRQLGVRD